MGIQQPRLPLLSMEPERKHETLSLKEELIGFLLKSQNTDGSWGYLPGKNGALEPTAYATLSLRPEGNTKAAMQKGLDFMRSRQTFQGGWTINTADAEMSPWASSLAGLTLLECKGSNWSCQAAGAYILRSFGRVPRSWIVRVAEWMQSWDSSYVDTNFGGWSWTPGTANWVEPTSYALIFLKKLRSSGREGGYLQKIQKVIDEAESFIYQRMCQNGGWNYGNTRSLGEELRPYPLTTALALIALQNQPERAENRRSLEYLKIAAPAEKSSLALSFSTLCLDIYDLETGNLCDTLVDLYQETQFFQNTKTSALALMALQAREGRNPFQFRNVSTKEVTAKTAQ